MPTWHFVLRKVPICEYCGAKRFLGEGLGFCCRQGKVNIFTTSIPDDLHRLFTSHNDMDAQYFRNNIRYFNSHFSFTSFGASVDRRVATAAVATATSDIAASIMCKCIWPPKCLMFMTYTIKELMSSLSYKQYQQSLKWKRAIKDAIFTKETVYELHWRSFAIFYFEFEYRKHRTTKRDVEK